MWCFDHDPIAAQIDARGFGFTDPKTVLYTPQEVCFAADVLPRRSPWAILLEVFDLGGDPSTFAANTVMNLVIGCVERCCDMHRTGRRDGDF